MTDPSKSPPEISKCSRAKAAASKSFLEGHYASMVQRSGEKKVGPRPKTITIDDFESVALIGKGAFGEVRLCKYKNNDSGELVAIKKLRKDVMHRRNQTFHVRAERSALAEAKNPWIVELKHCFQDENFLYVVMEYLPGGDLMTWLTSQKVFPLEAAKFYTAELCLAVHSVHELKYVHRDIKPDNVLLDANGHIKLTDFGLCKHFPDGEDTEDTDATFVDTQSGRPGISKREMFYSTVGSPGYVAPEVLLKKGYGVEVDWWSVGVIMFEMIYGYPPFYCDEPVQTCHRIVKWREYLRFPDRNIPPEYISFMQKLLCDASERMGFEEIKAHPLFAGMDWENLRSTQAYYQPDLQTREDVSYFPHYSSDALDDMSHHTRTHSGTFALKQIDPRGVMFADFAFNNVKIT